MENLLSCPAPFVVKFHCYREYGVASLSWTKTDAEVANSVYAHPVARNRNASPEPAYFVHQHCNAVDAPSLDDYCVPVTCTYSEKICDRVRGNGVYVGEIQSKTVGTVSFVEVAFIFLKAS